MYCRACGEYWGPCCRYLNKFYPVLKIEQFKINDPYDKVIMIKKWKDCPFYVEAYQPYVNDESDDSDDDDLMPDM
jgi:hypothetical protein